MPVLYPHKIILAPMMDLTDRHCRYFLRQISRHLFLYTEMVTTKALIHGDRERFLAFDENEHPVCLQLGGSDPNELAQCAKWAEERGYDEVNLNVGCPSDRVQAGEFGLCLMKKPDLVADCIKAMKDVVAIPVSLKTRIGYDHVDSYQALYDFIAKQVAAGVDQLSIHARKGWLSGLSPKENRCIPPLQYDVVYRIKQDFSPIPIALNGGVLNLDEAQKHLQYVDSVMIGRSAYYDSYILAQVDQLFYNDCKIPLTREEIVLAMLPYCEIEITKGTSLRHITQHWLGLYHGRPNAKAWRRMVTDPKLTLGTIRSYVDNLEKAGP